MIDEYFLGKRGWFVDDTFTTGSKITPEQNLLQELITSACRACDSYLKRGKIRGVQGNKALAEFIWNLSALRVVDEDMLETAGFRHRAKIRTLIGYLIAEGSKITNESKEVNVCV